MLAAVVPPEALYTGPHEYGRTHPDPVTAIDTARRLTDLSEDDDRPLTDHAANASRILSGLASRPDLTHDHVERITSLESCNDAVIATLIANPRLDAASALAPLLTHKTLPLFLLRTDAADLADQIIWIHGRDGAGRSDEAEIGAAIRHTLGQAAIEAHFNRALTDADADGLRTVAAHSLLTPDGLSQVMDIAEDPATPDPLALDLIRALTSRKDLTDGQGLRLLTTIHTVARRTGRDTSRWVLTSLITNRNVPNAVLVALLKHRARWARDLVLTMDHAGPEVLFTAARSHLPHAVMRLGKGTRLPSDAAHAVLADLEAGTARTRALDAEEIHRYTRQVVRHCEDPAVWDRALPLFVASAPEASLTGVGRYGFAFQYALLPDEPLGFRRDRDYHERVRAWLSAHPDPYLRIASLGSLYLREQVIAAIHDTAEEVRAAVLFHDLVDIVILTHLADDPSAMVRAKVARHPLADEALLLRLNTDPDSRVREAVTERLLEALSPTD